TEGAATRSHRLQDSRTGLHGNIVEASVAQILVEELLLRIAGFGLELLHFGIDVAVADENVRPAIIVGIEKATAPTKVLGVTAKPSLKGGILEIGASNIVIERGSVAGEIGLDDVEIPVEIIVRGGDAHPGLRLAVGA